MLLYFSTHLSVCQPKWHHFKQGSWACCAPSVTAQSIQGGTRRSSADHANFTRLDALLFGRMEPKHANWMSKLL